jgi:type II secretory pathway pseudopilin PulG
MSKKIKSELFSSGEKSHPTRPRVYSIRGSSPFTIVELLVVLSVIAMLASMMMPALSQATERARAKQCENNRRQYELAERMYEDAWNETPSDELESLIKGKFLNTAKLMECPSKGVYLWIGERGRDIAPEMGCSIHYYTTSDSESSSDDSSSEDEGVGGDAGEEEEKKDEAEKKKDDGKNKGGGGWWAAMDPASTVFLILLTVFLTAPSLQPPRNSRIPVSDETK